jgi:hypothetical protein
MAGITGAIGTNVYKPLVGLSFLYSVYYAFQNGIKAGAITFGKLWVSSFVIAVIAAIASGFLIAGGFTVLVIIIFILIAVVSFS